MSHTMPKENLKMTNPMEKIAIGISFKMLFQKIIMNV